ncbi:MAG: isoleucine--tRNA ligase [Gammaproteobacteria bacterium]
MHDYKNTLNLPTTAFPMKANLPQREPELLQRWEQLKLYQLLAQQRKRQPKFILHDGPPYANGHLHIGHALNKTLKDIVVKSKILSGYAAPFVPGWDCHGLPIEINVEKKHGKAGEKLSTQAFRAACREYATEQMAIQSREFQRLGVLGDWQNPYSTMDLHYEANIIRALAKIVENGHVQRGFKPVHWCIDCRSALAEAEVEYRDKQSPAIDVRFQVVDENAFWQRLGQPPQGQGKISIPIWTTTPWTLPANEAVALGAEYEYVLLQVTTPQGQERLLLSAQLLTDSLKRYGITESHELARVEGSQLEHLLLQHPFYDRQVPVVLGEHVTLDAGTGAVHTAPAHGQEDYQVGMRYQLPLINPVGDNGCFLPETSLFAGENVFKANTHIIEILTAHGTLLAAETIEHSYPHCWRHKTPIIFRATPQWFIRLQNCPLTTEAVAAVKKVNWEPFWGEERMIAMIADRPDWCISRQRSWGTPIPFLVHKQTGALHPHMPLLMQRIADRVAAEGMEVWFSSTPTDWLNFPESEAYEKVTDILDVWFDSGVSHFAVLLQRPELQFPADVYLEGSDQYRGWFQSSLLTAVAMQTSTDVAVKHATPIAPYKTVITHGFTVDEKGHKMSKSLGNVVAPEKVINSLGADILRLWVAATDYRGELAISDEILKRTAEAYRRLRNTARFLLANLHDFNPKQHQVVPEKMLSLDRWAVERAKLLQDEICQAYDSYQFHLIYQKLYNFCSVELGGFYLDIIKDRQYTMPANSVGRRSAQTALYHIAEALVRWLAPILSFTAEEIWQHLPGARQPSVFLSTWYEHLLASDDNDPLLMEHHGKRQVYWQTLMQVRDAVNKEIEKQRVAGAVGASLEAEVALYCEPNSYLHDALLELSNELRFVLITSSVEVLAVNTKSADATAITITYNDVDFPRQATLWVKVTASSHPKCARCWHRRADVGADSAHPTICQRCVTNLTEPGEDRRYA